MQTVKRKELLAAVILLLLGMLLAVLGSCKSNEEPLGTTEQAGENSNPVTSGDDDPFILPDVDLGGETYTILNCLKDQWNMVAYITSDGVNLDTINNAAYTRQVYVEQQLNCIIKEENVSIYDLKETLEIDSLGGQHLYAAAYQRADETLSGIVGGYYHVLDDVPHLYLERDYWAQDILKSTSLNNRHYFAASDLQLMSFDGCWGIYFNADILIDQGVEPPYQLVRDGEWTLEELHKISADVCQLNTDDTWEFRENGTCMYGFTGFVDVIPKLLFGIDALQGEKDAADLPYLSCTSNDFYNRAQALASFCGEAGTYYYSKPSNNPNAYDTLFLNERAVFVGAEIQFASKLREAGMNFGILPFPMYNTDQESYHTTVIHHLPVFVIPSHNTAPEEIGLIMDTLSHDAYLTMEDVYYNERVSLHNNSYDLASNIEMLNIMRSTRGFDIAIVLGVSPDLRNNINWTVGSGSMDISSTVGQFKDEAETQINQLRDFLLNQS